MPLPALLAIPKPRAFLHFVSVSTAAELITITLLLNKISGLYGILALFTGYELSALQLSHYVYNLGVLGVVAWLAPAIRKREPLRLLALAWIYVLDSVINLAYTVLFALSWFVLVAQHLDDAPALLDDSRELPGANMMADVAGFTSPEYNVSHVDVAVSPSPGMMPGQEATAHGSQLGTLGGALFQSGSITSLMLLAAVWTVRFYFCLIIMSYARSILRQHVVMTSTSFSQSEDATMAENPYRAGADEGHGWKGRLGRAMTSFPRRYWLGRDDDDDDECVRGTTDRLAGKKLRSRVSEPGVGERERRARSGTGPSKPFTKEQIA